MVDSQTKNVDIAIIGRGITGVSAAWELSRLGFRNIILIGPDPNPVHNASVCPGFITPSTIDNITRLAHGHGIEVTSALLTLGLHGFRGLKEFATSAALPWFEGHGYRFALTEHEHDEMKLAVKILNQVGFAATLKVDSEPDNPRGSVAIQTDGLPTAVTNAIDLLRSMESQSKVKIANDRVAGLNVNGSYVDIEMSRSNIKAEMVVIAAHLDTGSLIPSLKESLVSYADQWVSFDANKSVIPLVRGDLWIGQHGHFGIWRGFDGRIYMNGARFLRKWAGIEAKTADVLNEVTNLLLKKGDEWFGFSGIQNIQAQGILECKPCDELPIIGPMYGQNRLLVGVGYMGAGLALGFAAGQELASIAHKGSGNFLHPALTPSRLRSM